MPSFFACTRLFSPYSRGWSLGGFIEKEANLILPVFAGMVRRAHAVDLFRADSPRIRGDGPRARKAKKEAEEFSPYSRGWSLHGSGRQT